MNENNRVAGDHSGGRQDGKRGQSASHGGNPPPARPSTAPRDVEALLIWVYRDQMAHVDGLGPGAVTGYDAGSLGYGSCDPARNAVQFYAAMPKVNPYADAVHRVVGAALTDLRDYNLIVAHAVAGQRPALPALKLVPLLEYPGQPMSKTNPVRVRRGKRYQVRIAGRRVWVEGEPEFCFVERQGPTLDGLIEQRWRYRTWAVALEIICGALVAAGFDVTFQPPARLPLQHWETGVFEKTC